MRAFIVHIAKKNRGKTIAHLTLAKVYSQLEDWILEATEKIILLLGYCF